MEIERKWLVREPPADLAGWAATPIAQGYIAITDGAEVRLRRKGDAHLLTVKSAPGLVRIEEELALDAGAFERLWPLTEGRRVVKVRHTRREGDVLIELDVFAGDLAGLAVVEVEFPTAAASVAWAPPDWFGTELTGDPRWANQALAVHGAPAG